ncbi:DUF1028 domain-containing protein [Deinococcus sp. Marseille-Q6407]|uniref:DUF1028 domain-containing protein n=1 Tax=Deinococcus sp. Marseille-Q6407 TaxID=2969223 RepID=UPI0021BE31EE|nr:DUF1028 domain-containing protein [Deinococcus sp. Marseille-Q6407]
MTFSIVGRDSETGDLGVAVASKFLAVGAVVPYVRFGAGAVATQSYANPTFGPRGLELLQQGLSPEQVAACFEESDPDFAQRQFGLVSASGHSLSFTGSECHSWAGGLSGPDYAIQGNILAGAEVVQAMLESWQASAGQPLPRRLLGALQAGDRAGAHQRGRQSAALVCAGQGRGYAGLSDDWLNLRADDHADPCSELERLLDIHDLLFGRPEETRPLTPEELTWLRGLLQREGYAQELPAGAWDPQTEQATWDLYGSENLEERWAAGGHFDLRALDYLRGKFGA